MTDATALNTQTTSVDVGSSTVVTTKVESTDSTQVDQGSMELVQTTVFVGGGTGGSALPPGGAPNQTLQKRSVADADVQWADPSVPWNSTNW